jgi:hypothetical protein
MELTIYQRENDTFGTIHNFMDLYYSLQMEYLASDLLKKGLLPNQISDAVTIAIKIANSSGISARKHFMPIYSAINQEIMRDCKLSHLGYGLVLMNANPNLSIVADFQLSILKAFLKQEKLYQKG